MTFSDWLESTISPEKFTPKKALKYIKNTYKTVPGEQDFDNIFLDLAKEEMDKKQRLLNKEELDSILYRARIQSRHKTRNVKQDSIPLIQPQETLAEESMPRSVGTLPKEIYERLDKQLQIIKTTTNPLLSDGELGSVRNLKLKTTQENILKIVQELTTQSKSRTTTKETERAYQLETARWSDLARKIEGRLNKKVSSLDFKDYINDFEKSFHIAKSKA